MNEAVIKVLQASAPQVAAFAATAMFLALLAGLVVGMRMRKRFVVQAAEELLATSQFSDAANVQGEKVLRSVGFQEAVHRTIKDDARTQSGIINVVLSSAEIKEMVDARVKHGQINFGYTIDAKIRDVQEQIRREAIESNTRVEGKVQQVLELLMQHMENASR